MNKKIDFRQTKYILPLFTYIPSVAILWVILTLFGGSPAQEESSQETEYLNGELPGANVSGGIGSKRENMMNSYGSIADLTGVQEISNDIDSLRKKEEFDSKYTDSERAGVELQEQQSKEAELQRKAQQERIERAVRLGRRVEQGFNGSGLSSADEEEYAELERALGLSATAGRGRSVSQGDERIATESALRDSSSQNNPPKYVEYHPDAVVGLSDGDAVQTVVKDVVSDTDYFTTLSQNDVTSRLIKAIVDEEVKITDGSRIRLRLLDDITVGDVHLKKGTYLYARMSGFSQQRVRGNVESLLVGDNLVKVNLSIYDTDGMEGLYIPSSEFRETAKDIASSASQSSMTMNEGYGTGSFSQWAGQAVQNAYQRTSGAISKFIKKNRVRIKYGTQVYLINSREQTKKK